ncbi:Gibberellin 2-beta-dioxygenase 7 [Bienertia sinuspersici]
MSSQHHHHHYQHHHTTPSTPREIRSSSSSSSSPSKMMMMTSFALPPSPIPKAEGSRSAAVDDRKLTDYFSKNLQIPYLRLPDPYSPLHTNRVRVPAQIDYRLLGSRVGNSIERLVRSAREFGVVRIVGHGIPRQEVRLVKAEVELFFRSLDERKTRFRKSFVDRVGNREEFVWFRSDKAMLLWAREVMGSDRYRDFSRKMESVVSKLDRIAEELAEVLSKYSEKRFEKVIEERESTISLYRYNDMHPSLLVSNEDIHESYDHTLSLHLAMERGEFYVHTDRGPLSFTTDPDTIVVTVGEPLMEWSAGDFKAVSGELIFDPNLHGTEASYSLELKCSPLNFNIGYTKRVIRTISLVDQLLIILIISFIYQILLFTLSRPSLGILA